jgi:hypothetical protein
VCTQDPADKGAFFTNTRNSHEPVLCYMASLHDAWLVEPNNERITPNSACFLQAQREDFRAATHNLEVDRECGVVTLVLDNTTDKGHFHFCKRSQTQANSGAQLRGHFDDPTCPPSDALLSLAHTLIDLKHKDPISLHEIADSISVLASKVASEGKTLHVLALGCNTCGLVLPLKQRTFSFQCAFALLVSSFCFAHLVSSVSHILLRRGGVLHAPHIYFW